MEPNMKSKEFAEKVMEGLQLTVKKLVEEARKNNHPLVISVNGRIEIVHPS